MLLSSPYVRARQTAEEICAAGGLAGGAKPTVLDERLREREFGVFDGLTTQGIRERYPNEAEHRGKIGKFYHRPPGGESWADVILRLRSALNTINLQFANKNVAIVCHQVVVLCIRYILEELTEADILAIDKQEDILNCGICAFDFEPNQHVAVRAQAGAVEPWRADGGAGHAQDRRAGSDDRIAMSRPRPLNAAELKRHPLPPVRGGDKDSHGQVLIIGGSRDVPGALLLAAHGAMRAGAGKLQLATTDDIAVPLGIAMPEAMVIGLPSARDGGFSGAR